MLGCFTFSEPGIIHVAVRGIERDWTLGTAADANSCAVNSTVLRAFRRSQLKSARVCSEEPRTARVCSEEPRNKHVRISEDPAG